MSTLGSRLAPGAGPEPFVDRPLTLTDIVRYQGASGDMNPLHHDPEVARRAGFAGPISVGMLQAGILATRAAEWLGARNVRRVRFRFREPAWPGDVLTYRMVVVERRVVADEELVDLALTCTRQTGAVHIEGEATFVVPDEADVTPLVDKRLNTP